MTRPAAPSSVLHGASARWPGRGERGSLILPLADTAFERMPPTLSLGELALQRKNEFHLTLLDREQAARLDAAAVRRLAARFERLDWSVRSRGHCWLARKPHAGGHALSVVLAVESAALATLRAELAAADTGIEPPCPHVTLYWLGDPAGIGLAGPSQWRERVLGELAIDWSRATARPRSDRWRLA